MNKLNIAIIGYGFVGKAVSAGFDNEKCNQYIIDPKNGSSIQDLIGKDIDISFVCVPTPMSDDGSINSSIVEECIDFLVKNVSGLIVLKSTVIPSIIQKLTTNDRIIYNPEFLTEVNANNDFINPKMHIFGGKDEQCEQLQAIYVNYSNCSKCPVFIVSPIEASFIKYGINCFLASKVIWFNEFFDIIGKTSADYETVLKAMTTDTRIGESHTKVPGNDNKRGYSGSCFPKDTVAFAKYSNNEFELLNEVIRKNQQYRSKYEVSDREKEQNIRFDINI